MNYFVGVVEDRFDPKEMGRCRVRVFGVHTEDKHELPTADLPWAIPMQPMDNAATSGVGQSPNGVVHGTWVVGFFMDGDDKQQFMMMGTISSSQAANLIGEAAVTRVIASNTTPTVTSTADATPVVNSTTGTVSPATVRQPSGWVLGQTSKRYESGNKGAAAINDYNGKASGDLGGASYGTYQFASYLPATMPNGKSRGKSKNSPVVMFCRSCRFADRFAGLDPATSAFDAAWKKCASDHPVEFAEDQHEYVKANYYDVMIGNLKRNGLDLTSFGAGVQDLVWSTAVQMGPARTSVFLTPLAGKTQLDDVTIINLVSDYKINNVNVLFSKSSDNIKAGVANRYQAEKKDLLKLAANYNSAKTIPATPAEKETVLPPKPPTPIPADTDIVGAVAPVYASNSVTETKYTPKTDPENQDLLVATSTGFSDPDGVYPLKGYDKQPDTNKLARGIYKGTQAEEKSLQRATGIRLPNESSFDQPINPYNAKYPYNKVFQTESGHLVEYDDTPGAERINVWHKSGTFTEIDAVGNMVRRVQGSDYQITDGNGYVRIEGRCNISVGGSANVMVAADANIEIDGDAHITVGNDIVAEASGRVQISGGEAIDLRATDIFIEAENDIHLTAGGKINAQADGAMNLKAETGLYAQAGGTVNVKAGADLNLEADGNGNMKAGGDMKVFGGGSTHLKSSGMTALDGSTMMIQANASVEAGGSDEAEEAEYSQAGLMEGRVNYDDPVIEDIVPTQRADRIAMVVETPEEAANGGTDAARATLVDEGVATATELAKPPVAASEPESNYVLPTVAVPGKETDQAKYLRTLTAIPAGYRLTPNFTLAQLSSEAPAQRDKVRAQCGLTEGQLVANLYEVAVNVLEPIKAKFPNMFVTSAFRDFGHNTVKSSVSQHCLGLAVDMQFKGVSKKDYFEIASEIRKLLPSWDQLLLEYKNTGSGNPWIHVSYNAKGNRSQVMTFFNNARHSNGLTQLA